MRDLEYYRIQQPLFDFFNKRGNNILLYAVIVVLVTFIIFPYAYLRDKSLRSSDMKFDSDIIPDENITINLGSLDKQFDSIHGNEIFLQKNPVVSSIIEDGLNASSSSANSASYHVSASHVTRTSQQDDGGVKHEQIVFTPGMTKAEIVAVFEKGTDVTSSALNVGDIVCHNILADGITTKLHTTNTTIKDQLIELGNGTSGAGTGDAGIVIERGTSDNLFMGWDHDASSFKFSKGSFTGSSSGDLTHTDAALTCGALTASGAIDINATTFDVDASGAVTIDAVGVAIGAGSGELDLTTTGTMDINSAALTIDASGAVAITTSGAASDIAITTVHTAGVAFQLNANTAATSEVEINAGILDVNVTGAATIDAVGLSIGAGSGELDLTTTGTMDINSAALTIDASGAVAITASGVDSDIVITTVYTAGVAFQLNADTAATSEVEINAGILDVNVTGAATLDCTTLSLDATDDSNLTVTGEAKDLNIVVAGGGNQTLIASCAGTGADAISITASAGGIDITSAGVMDITTSASDSNINITPNGRGNVVLGKNSQVNLTASTVTTADNVTYTIVQLLGGLVLRDPNGLGRSDVTPTAADIVAGLSSAAIGTSFRFVIVNTSDGAEAITLTAGTNVKLSGTMTILRNKSREFLAVCTNVTGSSETVSIISMSA